MSEPARKLIAPPLVQKTPKKKQGAAGRGQQLQQLRTPPPARSVVPEFPSEPLVQPATTPEVATSKHTPSTKASPATKKKLAALHADPTPPPSTSTSSAASPSSMTVAPTKTLPPFNWVGPFHVPMDFAKLRDPQAESVLLRPVATYLKAPLFVRPQSGNNTLQPSPSTVRGIMAAAGNACYIAAVLQVVLHCPPLAHALVAAAVREPVARKTKAPPSVAATVGQWIMQCWAQRGAGAVGVPPCFTNQTGVKHVMVSAGVIADGTLQEDAMEFLQAFIKSVDKDLAACGLEPTDRTEDTSSSSSPSTTPSSMKGWVTVGRGKERLTVRHEDARGPAEHGAHDSGSSASGFLVGSVFDGTLRVGTKGTSRGGLTSVVVEPFTSIAVPVSVASAKGACPTVLECIQEALAKEALVAGDDDRGTKAITRASVLGQLPSVLVVQLMRWAVTREGEVLKLDNRVSIPAKLHIPTSLQGPGAKGAVEYRLQSVVCHHGHVPRSGHYVTYVVSWEGDTSPTVRVTLANDARVADVGVGPAALAAVEADTPYVLVYGKSSSHK